MPQRYLAWPGVQPPHGGSPPERPPQPIDPPCYFNSGCCSFADGDVTALEVAGGKIRLVRWLDDDDEPRAKLLVEDDLREIFARVRG